VNIAGLLAENGNLFFLGLVFVSAIMFSLTTASLARNWTGLRKRAASARTVEQLHGQNAAPAATLFDSNSGGVLDLVLPQNERDKTELRQFMNLAGFYGRFSPSVYQIVRLVTGAVLGLVTPFVYPTIFPDHDFLIVMAVSVAMALLGFMLPKSVVSLRRDGLIAEHRNGFPDFMDLLVICVEAGISIESAIDRTGKEFHRSYPSLSRNLQFVSSELRAGRSVRDALSNLGARLGIDEARAFATLVQQSEELGSSLVQTLRVYSAEMREKRYARAEAKAYGLPVKMVIPLGLFCFPAIMGVTLFPIALRISNTFTN
jgi:tight adherence protein C